MSRSSLPAVALVAILVVATLLAVAGGRSRWKRASAELWDDLRGAAASGGAEGEGAPSLAGAAERGVLPPPVARYFATVLASGVRPVLRATLRHRGDFALKPNEWKPFTSRQLYSTAPRGFVWDAEIAALPLVAIRVRDSYVGGEGATTASLGGVIPIVDSRGGGALGDASLLRYLAEAAWLPTALLPSEGVEWTAIDDSTARATLADGDHRVSMDVHFGAEGGIVRVTAHRGREVDGRIVPTPWEGRFSDEMLTVDGLRIPSSGEVAWLLPEGRFAYWRGRVTEARYEFR